MKRLMAIALGSALSCAIPAHAKPLVYCADASPEGFDPSLWDSTSTSNVTSQLFNGLVGFVRGTTQLKPELATAWQITPDAKSFTFTLRRGVRFHSTPYFAPTRELNADDVIFTFRRMTDPQHPFHKAFAVPYVYAQSLGLAEMLAGIDRIDDYTVRFRLKQANVAFLSYFSGAFAGIHSAEYAGKLLAEGRASAINNQPVGSGPFKFKSYRKDDVVRLLPHEDYWGGAQKTTQLIFAISREPSVRVQKMAAGECHITAPLRDIDIAALDKRSEVTILKNTGAEHQLPGVQSEEVTDRQPQRARGARHCGRPRCVVQGAVPAR